MSPLEFPWGPWDPRENKKYRCNYVGPAITEAEEWIDGDRILYYQTVRLPMKISIFSVDNNKEYPGYNFISLNSATWDEFIKAKKIIEI